jgi:hypothetical protein
MRLCQRCDNRVPVTAPAEQSRRDQPQKKERQRAKKRFGESYGATDGQVYQQLVAAAPPDFRVST